eukprot:311210_1
METVLESSKRRSLHSNPQIERVSLQQNESDAHYDMDDLDYDNDHMSCISPVSSANLSRTNEQSMLIAHTPRDTRQPDTYHNLANELQSENDSLKAEIASLKFQLRCSLSRSQRIDQRTATDQYEEMNEWVTVCPTDKDTTRTKTTPTQPNNGRNNDESDENGNNGCNHNKSGGESNGSRSGFNGSGNRDDDDDKDEENKPKNNTEDDDEDGEIDRFMYFLTHTIKTCDDAELRVVLSTFSNACIEKVLAGIQDVYNQKIRISKMRQPMRTKKLKQKKRYHFKSNSANDREPISNLNSLQIKSQYQITKSFTNDIIPSKVIGIPAIGSDLSVGDIGRIAYDYIIKSVAINEDNCYVNPKNTMRVFNFGLH